MERRREFKCEGCSEVFETSAKRGRFPRFCGTCDPRRLYKRRYDQLIRMETDLLARGRRQGRPGRDKLGLYVVAVANAKGGGQLVDALLDLAAAAVAWAVHLSRH
jgi:DNA-directed RNA polymerase subunit RPC12/RpoP